MFWLIRFSAFFKHLLNLILFEYYLVFFNLLTINNIHDYHIRNPESEKYRGNREKILNPAYTWRDRWTDTPVFPFLILLILCYLFPNLFFILLKFKILFRHEPQMWRERYNSLVCCFYHFVLADLFGLLRIYFESALVVIKPFSTQNSK